ncbi:MAG: nicotinate (nicotinamide) nucleotide adenylyltransferase [Gemmatimonadota bacterium]
MPTSRGRLATLGGAFDPPHIGHLIVAQEVVHLLALDTLLVIPAARPPHRGATLSAEDRLELARAAFAGHDRIEVSDVELRRNGPSFTVDTLRWARDTYDPDELTCVIGSDQYEVFETWHEPEEILKLARLGVLNRGGGPAPEPDNRFPFEPLTVPRVDVSSTEIRRRLDEGRSIRYLVPEAILDDIMTLWQQTT